MVSSSAVITIDRCPQSHDSAPLMLQPLLFAPAAVWLVRALQNAGVERFLILTRSDLAEQAAACFPEGSQLCLLDAADADEAVRAFAAKEEGEVIAVNRLHQQGDQRGVTNIVMMGSGEPMDNYDNVLRFLHLVSAPEGICISLRNVSVSTCGLCDRIDRLAEGNLPITLSISLHAPTDEARRRIMPVANKYGISRLMESCRNYVNHTGRRIVFEYALIEGVNTALEDADQLAALTRGLLCHVNLIPLNDVPERSLRAPGRKGIDAFQHRLKELGVSVTRRREMGADIEGACGQLRRKHLSTEGN